MSLILWLISGVIAGWLTGQVMRGQGYGLLGDLILGLLGGVIGGWVFGLLGLGLTTGFVGEIIVAVIGGIVLVAVVRLLR